MNNKYAIGTVIGTALLGLAKSSLLLGSASRGELAYITFKANYTYEIGFMIRVPVDSSHNSLSWFEDAVKEKTKSNLHTILGIQERFIQECSVILNDNGYEHDEDQEMELSFQQLSEQDSEEREERKEEAWNNWEDNRDLLIQYRLEVRIKTSVDLDQLEDNVQEAGETWVALVADELIQYPWGFEGLESGYFSTGNKVIKYYDKDGNELDDGLIPIETIRRK